MTNTIKLPKSIKVVEFASVLAGPLIGSMLAEMGAEVTKIENKRINGDVTRTWKLPSEPKEDSASAYYAAVNHGKKSIMLNLKEAEDAQKAKDLIVEADICLVNGSDASLNRLGLGYDQVKEVNPTITYAQVTGFSEDDRPAYDIALQAECGFLSMCGSADGGEARMPVALIDALTAQHLLNGILIDLWSKEENPTASKLSVSLEDVGYSSLYNQMSNYLNNGLVPSKQGTLHPNISPYGETFLTNDRQKIVLAIGSDRQFENLANILGVQITEELKTNISRIAVRRKLHGMLQQRIYTFKLSELQASLTMQGIPFGVIRDLRQVGDNEAIKARMLWTEQLFGKTYRSFKTVIVNMFK